VTAADDRPPVFDWSHGHTMKAPRPCRYCGGPTNLKDDANRACHKVCAEVAAANKRVRRHPDRLLEVAS
jgi:hypothetical protein